MADGPVAARSCPCGCSMSFHNWGTVGFPRITSVGEALSGKCDRCGHSIEGG